MQTAVRRLALSSSQASSFSSSKRVSIGSCSALYQTSPSSQGKSSAASVPSISCKSQRGKKISKEKRRALVESFIGKYRAQNAGIFPSVKKVQMEVGGSYYVIREMVQELEYHAKLASFNKVTKQPGKVEGSAQISDAAMSSATIVANEILKSSTMVKDEPSVVIEADASQIPPGEPVGCQTEISTIDSSADIPDKIVVKHATSNTTLGTDMEGPSVVIEADALQIPPGEPVGCQTEISTIDSSADMPDKKVVKHATSNTTLGTDMEEPSVVIEADASQIPPGEPVGCQTEISTIDSSADIPDQKVVKHARSNTTLGTDVEDLQPIENIRSSNHGDSPKATNFWSNLRSLADGIFSFWKKK